MGAYIGTKAMIRYWNCFTVISKSHIKCPQNCLLLSTHGDVIFIPPPTCVAKGVITPTPARACIHVLLNAIAVDPSVMNTEEIKYNEGVMQ